MANILIRSPDTCVRDYLKGIKATYPGLIVDLDSQIVLNNVEGKVDQVGVLTGGGAGHEPFTTGYVGKNFLSGSISGHVYAAPPASSIITALTNLSETYTKGILVVISNYTGDLLNFGIAIETVKRKGIQVESVITADDVAHLESDSDRNFIGRRGLCGAILLYKIIGGMSSEGLTMDVLVKEAGKINKSLSTMGFGLKPCTLPGSTKELWTLQKGHIEVGIGAHGEAGIKTIQGTTLTELTSLILDRILESFPHKQNDDVVLLINNMGTCSNAEMFTLTDEVSLQLKMRHIHVVRTYVGDFETSLDMKGAQISLLNVQDTEFVRYLDMDTDAFAWNSTTLRHPGKTHKKLLGYKSDFTVDKTSMKLSETDIVIYKNCILHACKNLRQNEDKINELDSGCGDGDCGSCLKRLAEGIESLAKTHRLNNVAESFLLMSQIAERVMGGTSGALYSLLFLGAAQNAHDWRELATGAVELVKKYSHADVGDRTMMDALLPACSSFVDESDWKKGLKKAVKAAEAGCERTAALKPRMGRACYVDPAKIQKMDAGAYGVLIWLSSVDECLQHTASSLLINAESVK